MEKSRSEIRDGKIQIRDKHPKFEIEKSRSGWKNPDTEWKNPDPGGKNQIQDEHPRSTTRQKSKKSLRTKANDSRYF
jgi:hypothetical protein